MMCLVQVIIAGPDCQSKLALAKSHGYQLRVAATLRVSELVSKLPIISSSPFFNHKKPSPRQSTGQFSHQTPAREQYVSLRLTHYPKTLRAENAKAPPPIKVRVCALVLTKSCLDDKEKNRISRDIPFEVNLIAGRMPGDHWPSINQAAPRRLVTQ